MTPEEFKLKIPNVSIGFIAAIVIMAFNLGVLYNGYLTSKTQIEDNKEQNLDYTTQEVSGLRSDWERSENIHRRERNEIIKRIDDLEDYHKEKIK